MTFLRALVFSCMVVFASTLWGCGGGGAEVKASSTTTGQELIDLKAAYDKGVITIDQYESQKEKILDRD